MGMKPISIPFDKDLLDSSHVNNSANRLLKITTNILQKSLYHKAMTSLYKSTYF